MMDSMAARRSSDFMLANGPRSVRVRSEGALPAGGPPSARVGDGAGEGEVEVEEEPVGGGSLGPLLISRSLRATGG